MSLHEARKLVPPDQAYRRTIEVVPEHIDMLGHVNNVVWLQWIVEIAGAHSESVGLDFATYQQMGVVWMVRSHEIEYLGQAREGDRIEACTWVATQQRATSLRRAQFRSAEDGKLLVHSATNWVLFDIEKQRPARIPEGLLARYGFDVPAHE